MKRYLAILCSSILFSVCLAFGFIKAEDDRQAVFGEISVDDVTSVEKDYSIDDLTVGDKLKLLWFAIITGDLKDSVGRHVSKNQREYIVGASAAAIILLAASIYLINQENQEVPTPKN